MINEVSKEQMEEGIKTQRNLVNSGGMDFENYMNSLGMEQKELNDIDKELNEKVGFKVYQKKMSKTYEMNEDGWRKKVKIGRNDKCSCGSGKKYKKCCLSLEVK